MANINRDYLIVLDAKSSVITEADNLMYYIVDEHSPNLFVNLVVRDTTKLNQYVEVHDPANYKLELHIVKPNNDIVNPPLQGTLLSTDDAMYSFVLPKEATDYIGSYKCELRVIYQETEETTITTSNKFKYRVKKSIYNNLDGIVDAPEYPLVIQLFDKLSDINQYEEDRRANELARQLAEEQRQAKHNELVAGMTNSIQTMDNKVVEVENRISAKEQAVDKLIVDTKADIDDYKVAKDTEIDEYKTAKDQQIDQAITNQNNKIDDAVANQNNKIDTAVAEQNNRIEIVEASDNTQNTRLDALEAKDIAHETRITNIEAKNIEQDNRLDSIEAVNVSQDNRLDAIEIKNQQQDDRLLDVEKVNKRQDMDLKCLFAESKNNMIDVTEEGNSIYLQNSTVGYTLIDEIQGNTMVNCNKEPDKEIILNGNINTQGYSNVTLTEGVNGGLVDVALEGNTMVNVCNQKDPVAITKSYTVETGNHVALQGEYDGKCRPVVTGNTLWIDNDTEDVLTAFDATKNLRLQSSFEDKVVTQEMVDNGEESAENLGKYKVDYVVTGKNKFSSSFTECWINASNGDIIGATDKIGTVDMIKVKPNTLYGFSRGGIGSRTIIAEYDKNKLFIKYGGNEIITTTNNTYYLRIFIDGISEHSNPMLVENGTNSETYEPYKEYTKTLYLNSPLLEGDTIEEKDGGIYHVHRSELVAYTEGDETSLITDKVNTLHGLAEPTYELIEQSNLVIPSYANGHLDFNTAIPVEKVNFLPFEEELTYLYANTQYTVQFVSDKATTADITLGGTSLLAQSIVAGLNRITITTPETLVDNKLIIDGVGANISEVVVTEATDQEFGYFEGMKSVGECEDLEVVSSNSDGTLSNTQTLTHEPLRAVGDIKDKYVLIDGKWYIERKCGERKMSELNFAGDTSDTMKCLYMYKIKPMAISNVFSNHKDYATIKKGQMFIQERDSDLTYFWIPTDSMSREEFTRYLNEKEAMIVYQLETPQYEPIDYNPFEVYGEVTHISNNSTIPCNMTIKNTGYNCLLKPSTTYTVSSNLGLNVVTTPNTLTEDCLRFYDTDTSDVTTMKDVTILEGDYTTGKLLPSHFSGIESTFEQEYDEVTGKYKVKIRVQNEDASKENYIEFYINEPLRGIGDVKDKVYVKDDKVVVERNCAEVAVDGSGTDWVMRTDSKGNNAFLLWNDAFKEANTNSDCISNNFSENKDSGLIKMEKTMRITEYSSLQRLFLVPPNSYRSSLELFKQYLSENPTTVVFRLAEPTYEEVEYNDVKLFIESFKNSTLFYNSNIPVTSKVWYSYSVPLVDTVAQTASISDEQDVMIIDLATQVAVMEMLLM